MITRDDEINDAVIFTIATMPTMPAVAVGRVLDCKAVHAAAHGARSHMIAAASLSKISNKGQKFDCLVYCLGVHYITNKGLRWVVPCTPIKRIGGYNTTFKLYP